MTPPWLMPVNKLREKQGAAAEAYEHVMDSKARFRAVLTTTIAQSQAIERESNI